MLNIVDARKVFNPGTIHEKTALDGPSLHLRPGEFVTVIGGNGAGKSTLLNAVSGLYTLDGGSIVVDGADVTKLPEHKRAAFVGRVFQDPMMGTAAGMNLDENLALAYRRGKARGLRWGISAQERAHYRDQLAQLGLGLEDRLGTKAGLLSGGQRQALTLLMATLQRPKVLLLDEHTAALDPKTAGLVLDLSEKLIAEHRLTTMMVTHNMRDAIAHGDRLIMMYAGKIVLDIAGEDKRKLTVEGLLQQFSAVSGSDEADDTLLLS